MCVACRHIGLAYVRGWLHALTARAQGCLLASARVLLRDCVTGRRSAFSLAFEYTHKQGSKESALCRFPMPLSTGVPLQPK